MYTASENKSMHKDATITSYCLEFCRHTSCTEIGDSLQQRALEMLTAKFPAFLKSLMIRRSSLSSISYSSGISITGSVSSVSSDTLGVSCCLFCFKFRAMLMRILVFQTIVLKNASYAPRRQLAASTFLLRTSMVCCISLRHDAHYPTRTHLC